MNFLIPHRVVSWQLFWILNQITIFCEFINFFVGYCDTMLVHVLNKLFLFWCTWNTEHLSSLDKQDLFLFFHLIKIIVTYSCLTFWDCMDTQGKRNPSKMVGVARGHQRADILKPYSQETNQSNHTRTTALSNPMKLSHAHVATQDGRVRWQNVVHWRREWQTTSVFLPWEPHEQYEKAKW